MKIITKTHSFISDLYTPVGVFLRIRDLYSQVFLLESSDYADKKNSHSFICCEPLVGLKIIDDIFLTYEDADIKETKLAKDPTKQIIEYINSYDYDGESQSYNGFFGYAGFDSIELFETIKLKNESLDAKIPMLRYDLFKYVVVFDHFHESITILENRFEHQESQLDYFKSIIQRHESPSFEFATIGETSSTTSDDTFKKNVSIAKDHCAKGDIFQVVLSRRFTQKFKGDDFNVYRTLRSINPSPYLFYYDYGDYHIFGSSPEAQIVVKDSIAEIHPIAGTMPRTGDPKLDAEYAKQLADDPKENAEHVMLVDLARNDLSKNTSKVYVDVYKETQYFSHVMHLTSKVKGELKSGDHAYQILADTFPAGTLSGAPKYRAMQIIDKLEPHKRGFYGGALGFISLDNEINHAIIIRSFMSNNNQLHFQAGAGIVIDSDEEKELQEVNNKLAALRSAIKKAEEL
jgi:anthranilate synthase component 1